MEMDYRELGRRIAQRRRALGLKQAQVCEMCEMSDKYLSAIEHARSIPSLEVFLRICNALDATPNALLLGVWHIPTDGVRADIAQRMRALDEKQLVLLHSFAEWLSQQDVP